MAVMTPMIKRNNQKIFEKIAASESKLIETINNVTVIKAASEAGADDLVGCQAICVGTPDYFSYMAGMLKVSAVPMWSEARSNGWINDVRRRRYLGS